MSAEKLTKHEHQEARIEAPAHIELLSATAESAKHAEKDPDQTITEALQAINEIDTNKDAAKELATANKAAETTQPTFVDRQLRQITQRQQLKSIRRKLPASQRTLSKVIHQPAIRVISETAGRTVGRPSGLLSGSLFALLGTSGYLFLAKYLGFTYNYSVFLFLFTGGFVFGLILELFVQLALVSRRRAD